MLAEKSTLSTFKICLAISILLHIIASVLSIGYHHGDEHFQILEFAGLKLGFNTPEQLAWEFNYKMRPAIQPLLAVGGIKFFNALSLTNPFTQAIIFRLFSAALSILSIVFFVKAFLDDFANPILKKLFIVTTFLLWIIVYTDVRFSSEGWSASFITLGIAMMRLYLDEKILTRKLPYLFLTGFIIGLSFVTRYQTGFFILGFGAWLVFVNKTKVSTLIYLVSGGLAAVAIGIAIDSWFYGTFTLSSLNYFTQNILENKASNYGVSPWYYYFTNTIEDGYVFFGLLSIVAFFVLLLKVPKNIFIWSIIPFVLIHSLIGHKESRFLFPIIKFAPYVVLLGFALLERQKPIFNFITSKITLFGFLIVNSILVVCSCFTPADYSTGAMKYISDSYTTPVRLYCIDNNPYESYGLFNNYYKPKEIIWRKIQTISEIKLKEGKQTLLVTNYKTPVKDTLGISFKRVYQTYPSVLTENLKAWSSRHSMKVIYKCEKTDSKKE